MQTFMLKVFPEDESKNSNRCIRGDMAETHKTITGKSDPVVSSTMDKTLMYRYVTGGINLRLQKNRFKYDLRKYCFTSRIVNTWDSLHAFVVSAKVTGLFIP